MTTTPALADDFAQQAVTFGKYLIGKPVDKQIVRRFTDALQHNPGDLTAKERRQLNFCLKHPKLIGFIDAGLALSAPHSELRRRLYTLLAIMESSPSYTEYFLPQQRSVLYIFRICFAGIVAMSKAIVGIVLVRFV